MTIVVIVGACLACMYAGLFIGGWCRRSKLDSVFQAGQLYEREQRQQADAVGGPMPKASEEAAS